jgi:hypothetical protein
MTEGGNIYITSLPFNEYSNILFASLQQHKQSSIVAKCLFHSHFLYASTSHSLFLEGLNSSLPFINSQICALSTTERYILVQIVYYNAAIRCNYLSFHVNKSRPFLYHNFLEAQHRVVPVHAMKAYCEVEAQLQ